MAQAIERWFATPKMRAVFPSSRGMNYSSLLAIPHIAGCLAFDGVASRNPAMHTICQVIYFFQADKQRNFRSYSAALANCTGKDNICIFGQVQLFKRRAKCINAIERN